MICVLVTASAGIASAQPAGDGSDAPPPDIGVSPPVPPVDPAPPANVPSSTDEGTRRTNGLAKDVAVDGHPHQPWMFADPEHHLFELDLEMFGTGAYTSRDGSSLSEFRLDRGELGTVVGLGHYFATELRLESVRSAAEGGALGVDGDSIVIRVKRAQVFGDYDVDKLHLHGAGGITPDPWITALETDYPLRPLSATASERVLGWPTSDLAGLGRVAYGPVRLSVSFGNGEGLDYPERNNGKTTTAVVEAEPLAMAEARLRLAAVARDGSVGPGLVRDRRFGGAATLWTEMVSAGGELVKAYGIADRGDLEALALAGWVEVRPLPELAVVGRFTTIGYANGGGRASSFGGAVALEPWRDTTSLELQHHPDQAGRCYAHCPKDAIGNIRLWLALDHTTSSGTAMPIPGADAGAATTLLVIVSTTAPITID
ncbi:MAG TPA: hypothetical protein VF403_28885 [Kofleriaceae bacterium]